MPWIHGCRSGPDKRTMPIPPRPGGVATATITSLYSRFIVGSGPLCEASRDVSAESLARRPSAPRRGGGCLGLGFRFEHPVDVPLLRDREDVLHEPVQDQPGREEHEHHG